jgi:hypothetical protein
MATERPAKTAPGWKVWTDRGTAALGIASAGTGALALAGVVTLGPLGWAGIGTGMATLGLWQLGGWLLRLLGRAPDDGEQRGHARVRRRRGGCAFPRWA